MSIFLFVAAIIIAYFIVKIGAAAFELTGLDPDQAYFQSLSAFTGTGFTTREAELIVIHKQRRRIASILMILGNVGFVTLIATLVNTINPNAPTKVFIPILNEHIPPFLATYVNLGLVLIILFIIYKIFQSSRLSNILIGKVQQQMLDKKFIQRASFEEFFLNAEGYGISQIEITGKNPLLGKKLAESGLREHDILVLSVERKKENIINPPAGLKFDVGDRLTCFGKLDNIRKVAYEEIN